MDFFSLPNHQAFYYRAFLRKSAETFSGPSKAKETTASVVATAKKAHGHEPAIPSPKRRQLPGHGEQFAPSVRFRHAHFESVSLNGGDNRTGAIERDHELVSSLAVAWLATQGSPINHGDGHADARVVVLALTIPKHESNVMAKAAIRGAFVWHQSTVRPNTMPVAVTINKDLEQHSKVRDLQSVAFIYVRTPTTNYVDATRP